MNTIITQQLYDRAIDIILPDGFIVDPTNINKVINMLRTIKKQSKTLNVYDITKNIKRKSGEVIHVNDHVNKTGYNPLIKYQKELNIDFIDVSKLYQKHKDGIITVCVGNTEDTKEIKYPSTYLCNISILANSIGIIKINALLINYTL